jgi:hypothetical protein
MAINHALHQARARRAWPLLVRRALKQGAPFTYGELCHQLGLHHRAASWFLGVIQTHCRLAGLPALQALAVNKKTRIPGAGYAGSPRTSTQHANELQKVYKHKWSVGAPAQFRT